MTDASKTPWVALTLGDPAGIGPELSLRLCAQDAVRASANLLLVGPGALIPSDIERVREPLELPDARGGLLAFETEGDPADWQPGVDQAASGRAALAALRAGHELAVRGIVDALVTSPVSKRALHMAGERCEGQTELLGRWCDVERFQMTVRFEELTVMLLTRHLPLAKALEEIHVERVLDHLRLLDETLRASGVEAPRLGLAGLNPHAGEVGILGSEEQEVLIPARDAARDEGLDVEGPLSPDSMFAAANRRRFDGLLTLYHDQAFLPLKLLAKDRGVTVLAGLPYPRVSPIHGTAYDLVGTGKASYENLVEAVHVATRIALHWKTTNRA